MDKKRLIEEKRAKRARFRRHDSHKKAKLSSSWRKPKGLHNKARLQKKGYVRQVKAGHRSPLAVRGLDRNGLEPARIANAGDLAKLDAKQHGVVLSRRLGGKKKIELIEAATKAGFTLLNATQKTAQELKQGWQERHSAKQAEKREREKKHKELEKKAESAEKAAAQEAEEKPEKDVAETSVPAQKIAAAEKEAEKSDKKAKAAKPEAKRTGSKKSQKKS